jgi:hypothetical protein
MDIWTEWALDLVPETEEPIMLRPLRHSEQLSLGSLEF